MAVRLKKIPQTIFQRFFRTETVGGLILLLFGLAALVFADSPLAEGYEKLWETSLTVGMVDHSLSLSLRDWINDGLMAVFFLLVGLEINASCSPASWPLPGKPRCRSRVRLAA